MREAPASLRRPRVVSPGHPPAIAQLGCLRRRGPKRMSRWTSRARPVHGERAPVSIRAQPNQIWPWLLADGRRPRRALRLRPAGSPVRLHQRGKQRRHPASVPRPRRRRCDSARERLQLARVVADRNEALVVEPVSRCGELGVDPHGRSMLRQRRLVGRVPSPPRRQSALAFAPAVDLPWILMERKMCVRGIKGRIET